MPKSKLKINRYYVRKNIEIISVAIVLDHGAYLR